MSACQPVIQAESIRFPEAAGVIDVTRAPYLAKPDGIADCTVAIQRALDDHPARGAIIYLPNGTNRLTKSVTWILGTNDAQGQKLIRCAP